MKDGPYVVSACRQQVPAVHYDLLPRPGDVFWSSAVGRETRVGTPIGTRVDLLNGAISNDSE